VTKLTTKELSVAGLIAALYTVLSIAFLPISFGVYQIRVAEALTVLPFLTPAAIPGLFIGCLLANILGGMGWLDIVFGPLITLVAAILTRYTYHFSKRFTGRQLAAFPVLLMWVGAVYLLNGFEMSAQIVVGLGLSAIAFIVAIIGEKLGSTGKSAVSWLWAVRITAVLVTSYAVHLMRVSADARLYLFGGLVLIAATITTMVLSRIWFTGGNPNVLVAPLPPVLLNAFGVSAYLAPLIGVNYWFSVQMVGVGQLIACYLIGLPLLMLLGKRKRLFFD